MRSVRIAEQALRLSAEPIRHRHICRACLAQAGRQIHTSAPFNAQIPFLKRLQGIFGKKESTPTPSESAEEAKVGSDQDVAAKPEKAQRALRKGGKKVIRGQTYEVATPVDANTQTDYRMAGNWHGLERIGSAAWVKKQTNVPSDYVGYLHKKPVQLNDEEWRKLLHHITVEVLSLKLAKRNLLHVCSNGAEERGTLTPKVKIVVRNGSAKLVCQAKDWMNGILATIPQTVSQSRDQLSFTTELQRAKSKSIDTEYDTDPKGIPSWMNMRLDDSEVKFAIVKRVMQFTNRRISDHAISTSSTLADLWNVVRVKEQPKKLYETSQLQGLKSSEAFPNVSVYPKRRTPVHKEQEIGRWKLIEEELNARNLPVLGSRHREAKQRLYPM